MSNDAPPMKIEAIRSRGDEQALLEFLRDRDVQCPLCRYNLRALTSARCPECGRELRLSVGLLEPRQGAWLTAQIATAGLMLWRRRYLRLATAWQWSIAAIAAAVPLL